MWCRRGLGSKIMCAGLWYNTVSVQIPWICSQNYFGKQRTRTRACNSKIYHRRNGPSFRNISKKISFFLQGGEGVITLEPCRGHSQKPGGVCLQFSSRVAQNLHFSVGNLPKKIFSAQVKKMLSTWVFRPKKGSHRILGPRILASEHDKWTWEDFFPGTFGDHGAVPNYTVKLVQFREGLRLNSSYALGSPAQHEMSYLLVLNNKYTTTKFQWWFAEKG